MMNSPALIAILEGMKHSPLQNYAGVPGLTSFKIGDGAPGHGMVRLFECSRDHYEAITPHSHRFDFHCEVLSGSVRNVVWSPDPLGDLYRSSRVIYGGAPGQYVKEDGDIAAWSKRVHRFRAGQSYSMAAEEVHSIYFSRGSKVLFFEGPTTTDSSTILEPCVDGDVLPTFVTPKWAYKKGDMQQ